MSVASVKAVVNGQTYNLTYNSGTQAYEANATAPSLSSYNQPNHYYGVTITATDDAGNQSVESATSGNFQENLRLYVKEKVAPVISITSPTNGARITNNKPTIQWTVTDADSGVDPDTISIKIDSGSTVTSGITKTPSGKNYTCSYVPTTALSDGSHKIYINAKDNDGNAAAQKSATFIVDTVAPSLNVTSPADNLKTNKTTVTVSGVTNDVTSSPVTVTVNGNNATVQSNGSFTTNVMLKEGDNTITIVATDSAGQRTTVTRKVTVDTDPPVFQSAQLIPNQLDSGQTYIIRVKVTD